MKKLILSAFAVSCMFAGAANAQLVGTGAYDDFNAAGTNGSANGGVFWFTDGEYPEQYDDSRIGNEWVINMNKIYDISLDNHPDTKDKGKYTVVGVSFGGPQNAPLYIDASGNKTMSFSVKATPSTAPTTPGALPIVSIQLEDANGNKLEMNSDTAASTSWQANPQIIRGEFSVNTTESMVEHNLDMTPAVPGVSNGLWGVPKEGATPCSAPNNCPLLDAGVTAAFDMSKLAKVMFLISKGKDYVGTVTFSDFKIGTAPTEPGLNGRELGKVTDDANTELVSPTGSYSFGSVLVTGSGSQKTFTIHNTGSLDLDITDIEIEGDDAALFTVSNKPTTVPVSGTATFDVTFAPTVASTDAYNAVVRIKNNSWHASKGEYVFSLNGTGTEDAFPQIVVADGATDLTSGHDLELAIESAGETATKVITIKNTGTADLTITDVVVSGTDEVDFTAVTSSNVIVAGGSTTLTITFSTESIGDKAAVVTITSDDEVTPSFVINVSGKIDATTSISKILAENTTVSPNPFAQDFSVSLGSNISGAVNLTVRNAHGAAVKTLSNVSASTEVSMAGLGAGVYYLEIASEGGVAVKKVIKQ